MNYIRIFSDADGESHFEDVSVNIAPVDFAPPAPPLNMAAPLETERTILCAIPAAWIGDWHPAPRRQFYIQLSGELEVSVSDGEKRKFSAGSLVLLEDCAGKGHLTRVAGSRGGGCCFCSTAIGAAVSLALRTKRHLPEFSLRKAEFAIARPQRRLALQFH